MNRRLFLYQQESLDMAWGCLSEAHTWEALVNAVERMASCIGLDFQIPAGEYGGLSFGEQK